MRVAILGLPFFARRVAEQLAAADASSRYDVYPFAERPLTRASFLAALPRTDVVYYIGGGLDRSRVVDLALGLGKRVVMHWVGTDITNAATGFGRRAAPSRYATRVRHLTEVSWTHDELAAIGVPSRIRPLVGIDVSAAIAPLPARLTVTVYAPSGRERDYGVTAVVDAARTRPDMSVIVVGGAQVSDPPANVECLGWTNDIPAVLDRSTALVRSVPHDGLAVSVLEALARGRHVLYSQPLPHTRRVTSTAELVGALDALRSEHAAGALSANTSGARFIETGYAQAAVARGLLEEFRQ